MTGHYEISPSRAARPALAVARFAAMLAVVSGLAHRFGPLATPDFLRVAALVFVAAILGVALCLTGFAGVWRTGRPGGGTLAGAALLLGLVLTPFGIAGVSALRYPALADVTTDRSDPPAFFALGSTPRGAGARMPGAIAPTDVALQDRMYAEVTGRRYPVSPDVVLDAVETLFAARGWGDLHRRGTAQVDDEILVEALAHTFLLRFPVDVVVRLTDEGESTYVDMRSASHYGRHDLGDNATRILRFLADLDAEMLTRAGS